MTELFLYDRAGRPPAPESAAALLPPWRRERLERLRRPEARQESLLAGLLYRYAMLRRGVDPDADVRVLPAGRPVREDVFFSLSHSGRYLLAAVSEAPVGADVQEPASPRAGMERFFHPAERARLAALGPAERDAGFLRLWTRKEAWVKVVSAEEWLSLAATDVFAPLPGLYFRDYDLGGGYAAAVCAQDPAIPEPTAVPPAALLP